MQNELRHLRSLREEVLRGPSEKATEAQHAKGKLTARERIELLLDEGSFREVEQLPAGTGRRASAWRTRSLTPTA